MELFKLFGRIAVENDEANEAIDETTGRAEESESRMSGAFQKIGAAVATYFAVDKIIDFGKQVVDAAATVSAEESAFEQIMGSYSDTATEKMNQIADNTGMVATRLTPYMTSMTAKFKGLGYDIDDATDLASDGLNLAADAAAFWDMSLDDSMSHLNSFINGSYEGGEAIGLFANDTQMAQYAIQQGLVESTSAWSSLDEATKQATRLEYAQSMMEASGAVGQAAKESDQYANVQANLTEKWRQFKAQIGEPLLQNVVNPAMEKLSSLVDWASVKFKELSTWVGENKTLLTVLGTVIGSVATGMIAYNGAQTAMTLGAKLHAAATVAEKLAVLGVNTAMLASPITWIVAGIAALIAIIVLCVKHWDEIKEAATKAWEKIEEVWGKVAEWFDTKVKQPIIEKFTAVKESISTTWENIKTKFSDAVENVKSKVKAGFDKVKSFIVDPIKNAKENVANTFENIKNKIQSTIESARDKVKSAIDKIKSFFNFSWSLPKLKLPHFSIKGKFSLDPPSVPKLAVDWYAKAMNAPMLLTKPTIFGMNPNGNLMGGGEAGNEVVSGASTLMNMIQSAVGAETSGLISIFSQLVSILSEYFPEIIDRMEKEIVLDDGTLVGKLAPKIDTELGNINRLKIRGN